MKTLPDAFRKGFRQMVCKGCRAIYFIYWLWPYLTLRIIMMKMVPTNRKTMATGKTP